MSCWCCGLRASSGSTLLHHHLHQSSHHHHYHRHHPLRIGRTPLHDHRHHMMNDDHHNHHNVKDITDSFYPSPITLHCFCFLWHICFVLFITFLSVRQFRGKRPIPWIKCTDILFTTLSNSAISCTSRQCWYAACTYYSTPLPWSPTSSSWTTLRSTSTTSSGSSTPTMPSFKRVSSTQEWSPTW